MPTNEAIRQNAILAQNLKDMTRNLSVEYDTHTNVRKQQEKLLDKYNQYINIQNKKLNNQLNELNEIESRISTRDSLVRSNLIHFQEKKKKIRVLQAFFITMAFNVFSIVAFLANKISLPFLLANLLFSIVSYSIYYAWIYNFLSLRQFTHFVDREAERMKKDIYDVGRDIESDINQYVNEKCDCPPDKNGSKPIDVLPMKHFPAGHLPSNDGVFYYDGTAPQQRIIPEVKESNYRIDWEVAPDMGSRDNKRYTPKPTWMSQTVGLPRGSLDGQDQTCPSKTNGHKKVKDYSTKTVGL